MLDTVCLLCVGPVSGLIFYRGASIHYSVNVIPRGGYSFCSAFISDCMGRSLEALSELTALSGFLVCALIVSDFSVYRCVATGLHGLCM